VIDSTQGRRRLAWGFVVVLAVLHYDFWFWSDRTLVFGFVPVGLFFQVLISLGAAAAWFGVVRLAWPAELEAWAEGVDDPGGGADRGDSGDAAGGTR